MSDPRPPRLAEDPLTEGDQSGAILDAAGRCVSRLGLDKVTIEDIAREARISRATLYRRAGGREAILTALLRRDARPWVEENKAVMRTPADFGVQLEAGMSHAVATLPNHPLLNAFFQGGLSPYNLALIRPVYAELVHATLMPALEAARGRGLLRTNLASDEVSDWLMRSFIFLASNAPWGEARLRDHIRKFVLPVLFVDTTQTRATDAGLEARWLEGLETRVADLGAALADLRAEIAARRRPAVR